ncbi:MAG TPA: ankyrin repeat domain-containing protein [Pyrinomonadaceae bacterium]|nr:ankyrin repeat domain-containing protein [Pyrinomonadaceae bacterium]
MLAAAKRIDVTEELSHVVESGDVEELARLLPRVADLNARNRHGTTALMKAAGCGHTQIVRLLLEHGADPNVMRNDKFTALALAAFFGHTETVKTLMEFGARTEAVTRSGASAHTWATARTFSDVARCLDTPAPKPPLQPRVQLRRSPSRNRILALGVIASVVLMVCCGLGALVLRSSEARDLPPSPPSQPVVKVEPPKVENAVITTQPEPEPAPQAPKAVVNEAFVRPTIKKAPVRSREARTVTVLTEKPVEQPAEKVEVSEPPVVAKPKFEPPKPTALSPHIMAPTKKAKVIQWP